MARIQSFITDFLNERPARKATWESQIAALQDSGATIRARCEGAADTDRNKDQLSHLIGIERWGQSRLRSALGAPLTLDEYDGYRPAPDTDWPTLVATFAATRDGTVALARELQAAGVERTHPVPHNQFGALTVGGWLHYLRMHAALESRRIR